MHKHGNTTKEQRAAAWLASQNGSNPMIPVPTNLTALDRAFGNIKHLPPMKDIPEEYHNWHHPAHIAATKLFFGGGKLADLGYTPREGVNVGQASVALGAILASFEPKHEHKTAGVAYLIDQWFQHDGRNL